MPIVLVAGFTLLPTITFAEAWQAYRAAEIRLPPIPPPVAPQRVGSVAEIADAFDLVVLDAWGVLNLGPVPIASAGPAVEALRRQGKRLVVLSNDAGSNKDTAIERHRRCGFRFALDEVIAGLDLLPEALGDNPPERVGVIVDEPLPMADLTGRMRRLGSDRAAYDEVAAIAFLTSDTWTGARQRLLRDSLATSPRKLIVCNPDIASPGPDAMWAEPGWFGHRIAAETAAPVIFCGKPFPELYARIRAAYPDIPPDRVLCVGDTPHTDILGGRNVGFRTMLVEDGFCRGRDAIGLCRDSGIWPDFIAPRL